MYISENCSFIPYTSDFDLDEKLDAFRYLDDDYHEIIKFLSDNNNYGLDEIFRRCQIEKSYYSLREYIAQQGYGLDILINDNDYDVRIAVAEQGYGLDKLINDKDWAVRKAVAKQGYGLDILINDESDGVLAGIAEQGYGLDKLIDDKSAIVRKAVARQGYGLDILINDENYEVRCEVAKQGYGLDKLVNDENYNVCEEVARQGYGLDKLVNDKSAIVCSVVEYYLKENNLTLLSWWNENADKHYYESFHDIINENTSDNSVKLVNQLLEDNMYLDWILKNTSYKSETRKAIIALGYHNLQAWKDNYPSNVYYTSQNDVQKSNKIQDKNAEPVETQEVSEAQKVTQDFVVKINDSKTLAINESEIDDFFDSNNTETEFIIFTVDTKLPIIKIEKVVTDENVSFKFIVDITNEQDDNFSIKSTIQTQEQLNKLIEQTIDALNNYPQFIKYTDDLANCL